MTTNPSCQPGLACHRRARALVTGLLAFVFTLSVCLPGVAKAAFGLTAATDYYQVDTGAGLVFKVRRTDNGVSTQSAGDLMSLVYNGVEYQNQSRGTQINSGFDWLYNSTSAVTVDATTVGADFIRITVTAGDLTHYYMARNGFPHIYMATHFVTEPDVHGHVRYIVRIPESLLPNGPVPSDIRNNTGAIESGDIFGLADGTTRSKHYSNMRLKDWSYIGATGTNVGVWMFRSNHEGDSGGPFYRSLLNQCGGDQEITYILNYGQVQTEAFRPGTLNGPYALVFNNGSTPSEPDTSWVSTMGLTGYVAPSGRGSVSATSISGRDASYDYTVGFANATAQYWADVAPSDGSFTCADMIPGTYTMKVYKNEYAVQETAGVMVSAGTDTALGSIAITADPNATVPLWRIGNWDGTPWEFVNGDKVTTMHPSDVRMASWNPGTYVVGSSVSETGFPAYQWKDINANQVVQFNLSAAEASQNATLRVGITVAYSGARPNIQVNSWTSGFQSPSSQPGTRSLTTGSYRGNNTTFTFNIPSSALVAGTNTLTIYPISGSGLTGFLSAGYSNDAVDFYLGTPQTVPIPGTPSGLSAAANGTSINLSWSAAANATGYTVKRSTTAGGPYTTVATGVASATHDDGGLDPNTTYYYVVSATNSSGASPDSNEASATTANPVPPPSAPTGLTATAASISRIDLSWSAATGADTYNVKWSATQGGPYTTLASGITGTSYIDDSVLAGSTIYYVVSSSNSGGESAHSGESSATTAELVADLPFDETSGGVGADLSPNGYNATLVNGTAWTSGIVNNALALDGIDGHAVLPTGVVRHVGDFTIATWVHLNSISTWSRVFDFGSGPTANMFLTPQGGAGVVRFAITTNGGGGEELIDGTAPLPTGAWTHVAVTLEDSVGVLYVNGTPVGSNNAMTLYPALLGETTQNYLGRSQYPDPYLDGALDEFLIVGRALSDTEIAALAIGPGGSSDDFANGELVVAGSLGGSLGDTYSSDNAYESVTEVLSGGKPSSRHSLLEHKWTIDVVGGEAVTFFVEAHHSANTEGDDFVFAYSTDDASYTDMVTVTKTADDDQAQSYALPNTTSGNVYIRVRDTDQSQGNQSLDTLFIDQLYIRSDGDPPPNSPPAFVSDPVVKSGALVGTTYSDSLSGDASDPDSDPLGFTKLSGPAWLTVAANGDLSGTPGAGDLGLNTWSIEVDDGQGGTATANLEITVSQPGSQPDIHVSDIAMGSAGYGGNRYTGIAAVTVLDEFGAPVANATVTVNWSGATNEGGSGVTNANGVATMESSRVRNGGTFTVTVTNVSASGYTYTPAQNVETSDTITAP